MESITPFGFASRTILLMTGMVLLLSASASAQGASALTGAVLDEAGLVLPGVTVEASSPALIEGDRTVVTNGQGRYTIVDLRAGTYAVTFTLGGFATVTREGVELPTGFTATIDVELAVGTLQESITVTGASPVVDVVSGVPTQTLLHSTLEQLPQVKSFQRYGALIPAVQPSSILGGRDVGGSAGEPPIMNRAHGSQPGMSSIDGINIISMASANWRWINAPSNMVQESVVQLGNGNAEALTGGPTINLISKAGGNTFSGNVTGEFTNEGWDADNLTDELIASGVTTGNKIGKIFDFGFGVGGPIVQDKLWFFGSYRKYGTKAFVAGNTFNLTPHTLFFTPDPDNQAYISRRNWASGARVTFQATAAQKLAYQYNGSYQCFCPQGPEFGLKPSGSYIYELTPQYLHALHWTYAPSNRLLIQARGGYREDSSENDNTETVFDDDRAVIEASTGWLYGANGFCTSCVSGVQTVPASSRLFNGSVSYITGTHSLKVGLNWHNGNHTFGASPNYPDYYIFLFQQPLFITSLSDHRQRSELDMVLGLFAQDSWTLDRLTLNLGVRYDHIKASSPAQTRPAGFYTPEIFFDEYKDIPNWQSIHPRMSAAYDLFGTGKTAIKGSFGRYEYSDSYGLAFARTNSPVGGISTTTTRLWLDLDGDFEPDCDLKNGDDQLASGGECGAWNNQAFGTVLPIRQISDEVRKGFNVSPSVWQSQVTMQQELTSGVSLTVGYFRTWYNNIQATNNRATTLADYNPYCITAPLDVRLPGGGGNEVCEFFDVSFEKFGLVDNLINLEPGRTKVYNGFDVTINARLQNGVVVFGGINTGQTTTDNCPTPDAPGAFCKQTNPYSGDTSIKMSAVYPVPWQDINLAVTYQDSTGAPRNTTYVASNAEIAPSLGRNLSSCSAPTGPCSATQTLTIVEPTTQFEPRSRQLDLRVSKTVALPGGGGRLRMNFDLFNLLNASAANSVTGRFGPQYLRVQSIMPGRMLKLGGQVDW